MKNKKLIAILLSFVLIVLMAFTASAVNVVGDPGSGYPGSGDYTPAEGSSLLKGKVIGAATGWDENPANGAAAAFDGNLGNNYDQKETGNIVTEYPGMMMEEKYILTSARILPCTDVDWQAARMQGAAVQGSNDGENWVTLYKFASPATVGDTSFVTVTEFENNVGYTMFRYCNIEGGHTDCRELEFYGYAGSVEDNTGEGTEDSSNGSENEAADTSDLAVKGVIAAVAMATVVAAVAVRRKKNVK